MDNDTFYAGTQSYPFPTPEVSVDPAYQELYNYWLENRETKESITVEDKFNAIVQDPYAYTKIGLLGVFAALLALAMMIIFRRAAKMRNELEQRMTACTRGTVVKLRQGAIGRRIVRYATVRYLRDGFEREDEYLLAPETILREGDETSVLYDPNESTLSQICGYLKDDGREYDVVLIPFLVVGIGMALFGLLCAIL